jgi:hypothetical protein
MLYQVDRLLTLYRLFMLYSLLVLYRLWVPLYCLQDV